VASVAHLAPSTLAWTCTRTPSRWGSWPPWTGSGPACMRSRGRRQGRRGSAVNLDIQRATRHDRNLVVPLVLVVALIVGAVGVANIMIISVLERRSEIGLRRALGATKGQIRTQFLAESILLAVIGGVVGVLAGAAATAVYASSKSWAVVIPVEAWSGGIASAILIGAFAGLMPAVRASRMPPTVALRTV
jgi:ABC-type antimicrobial peptide transport system permease subunit